MKQLLKPLILSTLVIVTAGTLTACSANESPTADTADGGGVEQKQGTTSKTGVISEANGTYFIKTPAAPQPEAIESYDVDLGQYVGETVTVEGQYSGNTLFVSSVE